MSEYNFQVIEQKWQKYWFEKQTDASRLDLNKKKYYILDMFPYPSGAGLHVGHPLGYIATDILARYKKMQGFSVLHPMGFDAFGLPAEQYAIQTGQHPAETTSKNIETYKKQLNKLGLGYDWTREIRTCDASYYKWTQFIFIKLFNSWYNKKSDKAETIETLVASFDHFGNEKIEAATDFDRFFSANEWKAMSEKEQQQVLLSYRLAYIKETWVNWCPALGSVLANEEVKDGVSERGGFPVERKLMPQWCLRITAYAERLLQGLETISWPDSVKELQRNWIGKSEGATVFFQLAPNKNLNSHVNYQIEVFTTRPDTLFGVSFLTLAPEHELVEKIVSAEQAQEVNEYIRFAKNRSERERQADIDKISGVFTGAYAIHPITQKQIPIWIGDYVLAGYGTGAVMAVPCGDQRDWRFAKHFNLPIPIIIEGYDDLKGANESKLETIINSDFLNGLKPQKAIQEIISYLETNKLGFGRINYRLRDAIFGRQRYWGEPIPIYYKDGMPYSLPENELPLTLPEIDAYLPTETGEPPLARAKNWQYLQKYPLETSTMPGWAGSSWYYLRYCDPQNEENAFSEGSISYWKNIDLYVGGSEHATGHLLYVRFWTKFLHDLSYIPFDEPANKLINQGMILGRSNFVFRDNQSHKFISAGLVKANMDVTKLHVDVNLVENDVLDLEGFKAWRPAFQHADFELESGQFYCSFEIEKMSKSKYNVVNPDDLIGKYGADTLRMYEMFLGPIEQSKPWNTNGITGVFGFLRKFHRLFFNQEGIFQVNKIGDAKKDALKVVHKTIKKINDDMERLSFNTSVSTFMICVNDLQNIKCNHFDTLSPLVRLIAPFAPHLAEELWHLLGHDESVFLSDYPIHNPDLLVEDSYEYPLQVNGKTKGNVTMPLNLEKNELEKQILEHETVKKYLIGNQLKKLIVVPGRIINLVI